MTLRTFEHRKRICTYFSHIQKDSIINMDYVRLSTNLYIHHVRLSRNFYIHYVRLSTSYNELCFNLPPSKSPNHFHDKKISNSYIQRSCCYNIKHMKHDLPLDCLLNATRSQSLTLSFSFSWLALILSLPVFS